MAIEVAQLRPALPYRAWVHDRLECALYVSSLAVGLNGYVRLPENHDELMTAYAHELSTPLIHTVEGETWTRRPLGYDALSVPTPGGWTYGPDFGGWVGFDTAHAWDRWPMDFCLSLIDRLPEHRQADATEYLAIMTRTLWTDNDHTIDWTEERIIDAVNEAASTFASMMTKASKATGIPLALAH